jgi:hypothetical protein
VLSDCVHIAMTTAERTTRRVYSAEQLHKLRASFSAPKLREAIEEHDHEDAELVKGTSPVLLLPPPELAVLLCCCLRCWFLSPKHQRAWRCLTRLTPRRHSLIPAHITDFIRHYPYHCHCCYAPCRGFHASLVSLCTKRGWRRS